ncbi:HEPN domain-containing protein [Nitrososphaera sp.]|uniref:HEPN domain-containing protein n=1 Tax=Nitrososphaera sp. TaxID=1971748 RepID=UPI00181F6992|nr:HEPN domain-containing protein [Nitrososphaera sp.]NWG36125.1 hypothetical protein [Nitrososphaera sp.]
MSGKNSEEERIVKLFHTAISEPDDRQGFESIKEITTLVERSKKYSDLILRPDLVDAYYIFKRENIAVKASVAEVEKFLKDSLFKTADYDFYFPIYRAKRYPDGYKIGNCVALAFEKLPQKVQEIFLKDWDSEYTLQGSGMSKEHFIVLHKESLFLSCNLKANGQGGATTKARMQCEQALDLLRIVHGTSFKINDFCFVVDKSSEVFHRLPIMELLEEKASVLYSSGSDSFICTLNDIMIAQSPTELEQKIKNAVHLFAVATSVSYPEVKFVILCSAMEAMLLSSGDKDYLGWKLAERAAFLLEPKAKRESTAKEVADLYNMRSRFVHQDAKDEPITSADYSSIENVMLNVLLRLIEMRKRGYTRVSKCKNAQLSIADYVDMVKYSGVGDIIL